MNTTIVNLVKGTKTVAWSNIAVKSAKYDGTLSTTNVSILPKKSECSEETWRALGCLETIWKSFIRRVQYPKDAERHTNVMERAISEYHDLCAIAMPTRYFRDIIVSAMNVHWSKSKKSGDGFSATTMLTFKKSVVRITMRIQDGTFALMNNVKSDNVAVCKSFNVKDLTPEQIAKLLGLSDEQWAAIQAVKSAC